MKTTALVLIQFLVMGISFAAEECDQLPGVPLDRLMSYLEKTVPNEQNAATVACAINTRGARRYEPATAVLTKLLDFRRPPTAWEKAAIPTSHNCYPPNPA